MTKSLKSNLLHLPERTATHVALRTKLLKRATDILAFPRLDPLYDKYVSKEKLTQILISSNQNLCV